ncbi:enoyl-CoA hydratase/isomerase family protein, partial [Paraburkholderia sp. BR14319]
MSIEQKEMTAGADEVVQVRREGDVSVVTMNYPERRNAFSMKMRLALTEVFQRLMNDDPDTRAIVLTGAGGHFCAGGDLSEMHAATPPLLALRERIAVGVRLFKLIYTGTKPVVAAVEGTCYGAGVSLAAACDVVVSAETAKYSCAFGKV